MSRRSTPLSTTSYALLGLLGIKPWTTYELARQMDRGMGKFWPRARSKIFEEPRKLVGHGLAKAAKEKVGRRSRTIYTITPKGRRALAEWLKSPGEGPVLEWEQLIKVFFAEQGTKADLLATLSSIAAWAAEQRRGHEERALSYLRGEGPFPERTAILALTGGFLGEFAELVGAWAARATAMVEQWPDVITTAEPDWATLERFAGLTLRR